MGPSPGAYPRQNPAGATLAKMKSHLDGTFQFSPVIAGEYFLLAREPSSRGSAQQHVLVLPDEMTTANLALRLAR